jgi:hypothetical protein
MTEVTGKRKWEEEEEVEWNQHLSIVLGGEPDDLLLGEDDIAAHDIDFVCGAFSSGDESDDEDELADHPVCMCTFTGSAAKICTYCAVLKTFAFATAGIATTAPVPPATIDRRIPRITISLPLPGISGLAAVELVGSEAPEKIVNTEVEKSCLTRKDRVLRWKAKRQRMLNAPKATHYEQRRKAALSRKRKGGMFKKESNFVSVTKLVGMGY